MFGPGGLLLPPPPPLLDEFLHCVCVVAAAQLSACLTVFIVNVWLQWLRGNHRCFAALAAGQ